MQGLVNFAMAIGDGYDGWMEDFGEYTPTDSVSADGRPGAQEHNLYPVLYHRTAYEAARGAGRPIARFNRSGWTGSARYSQIVWGGDPTTSFGFDGLTSAVRNGLSMGLSGVSLWGSDIGGFFSIARPELTPEIIEHRLSPFHQQASRSSARGLARVDVAQLRLRRRELAPCFELASPVGLRLGHRCAFGPLTLDEIRDRTAVPDEVGQTLVERRLAAQVVGAMQQLVDQGLGDRHRAPPEPARQHRW